MERNIKDFTNALSELCKKHSVYLGGKLRILDMDRYEPVPDIIMLETMVDGIITDRTGPFLLLSCPFKPQKANNLNIKTGNHLIIDKDKALNGGVVNPLDGKKYDTRHKWDETLKRHNCHQADTSMPTKKEELKGNYNARKELTEATREVLSKRGLN